MGREENPILRDVARIPFHEIQAAHVEPAIRAALAEAVSEVEAVAADEAPPTWSNTIQRLDDALERLSERIAPASHLMSVAESPELRSAYNAVLPDISAFWSSLPLDPKLWARVSAFEATDEAGALSGLRRRHLDKTVSEFRRAGADLPDDTKERLKASRWRPPSSSSASVSTCWTPPPPSSSWWRTRDGWTACRTRPDAASAPPPGKPATTDGSSRWTTRQWRPC